MVKKSFMVYPENVEDKAIVWVSIVSIRARQSKRGLYRTTTFNGVKQYESFIPAKSKFNISEKS